MAHHAGVAQVGLVAGEDVQVGTAHAHALDAQQHLIGSALGQGAVMGTQGAGGFTNNGQHGDSFGSNNVLCGQLFAGRQAFHVADDLQRL